MSTPSDSSTDVNADLLNLLLNRNGWRPRGGRRHLYTRWSPPDEGITTSVIVPLDAGMADYNELLNDSLAQIRALAAEHVTGASAVLNALTRAPGDEIRFSKDTITIRGAVPWEVGEDLFGAAKGILLAGAKSRVSRRAYYGQRHGRFARRFLDAVLMGQTEIGSYVVTAFAPPTREFPEKSSSRPVPALADVASYRGREIVESIVSGLDATQDAIEHFENANSMSGFEDGVRRGVSRELMNALHVMVEDSDHAGITVSWSDDAPATLDDRPREDREFVFHASAAAALERASRALSTVEPSEYVRVIGWVSVVARPKRGEPGLIRLKVLRGSDAGTLQVRLMEDQFEVAASAITTESPLVLSGRQEREGNRYWLYDASSLEVVQLHDLQTDSLPWH